MEGPTPVSALIHAATMVAAGVYMLFRVSFLLGTSPLGAEVVAWVGAFTSLFAALVALAQSDVKRVLAYSTMSQLGYMVMAVGAGSREFALFHLTTHAFFKALLFLAAASVLHAMHHERDAFRMGGLWRKLPLTCAAFAVGALALSGVWPLSGFFSKDLILLSLSHTQPALFTVAMLTAVLTPLYIGRTFCMVFLGQARDPEAHAHAHESPGVMTAPLFILAVFAVAAGWGGQVLDFLSLPTDPSQVEVHLAHPEAGIWGTVLLILPGFGLGLSFLMYGRGRLTHDPLTQSLGALFTALKQRLYVDELYARTLLAFQSAVTEGVNALETRVFGAALPEGVASSAIWISRRVRSLQSGHVGAYLFAFGAGAALLFVLLSF
jgi:NADH-quinone oxidoreductase subunit L